MAIHLALSNGIRIKIKSVVCRYVDIDKIELCLC